MLICDVVREVWGELGETEYLPEEDDSKVGVVLESGYVLVFEDSDGFWRYEASFSDGEVAGSSGGLTESGCRYADRVPLVGSKTH